jgi:IS605 OrfB family transposase
MKQPNMRRTIPIKIEAPTGFLEYIKACNDVHNDYIDWCFNAKSFNKKRCHKETYFSLRAAYPQIPSGIIQSIRDVALGSVKALKFKYIPYKKPYSSVGYDIRSVSLIENQLSIAWSGPRIKQKITIPEFFKKRYGKWKFQAAQIGYDKFNKCFVANLIFREKAPSKIKVNDVDKIVGVDRGIYNVVSLSDGSKYPSQQIRKNKREVLFLKRKLQAKGTPSAKRKLKKLSRYERRFSLNVNHNISKQLVNLPYDIFVLEDLTGIRKQKSKGKKLNKLLSNWSFWQLELLLGYKAEALGKQVVYVAAPYTSQKCSSCGEVNKKNRKGSHFCCDKCGLQEHADVNAAKNIRNDYIFAAAKIQKAKQAAVNQPNALLASPTMQSIELKDSDTSQTTLVVGH